MNSTVWNDMTTSCCKIMVKRSSCLRFEWFEFSNKTEKQICPSMGPGSTFQVGTSGFIIASISGKLINCTEFTWHLQILKHKKYFETVLESFHLMGTRWILYNFSSTAHWAQSVTSCVQIKYSVSIMWLQYKTETCLTEANSELHTGY